MDEESAPSLVDFVEEFCDALKAQLIEDEKRWGATWLNRPLHGQVIRTLERFDDYFDQWLFGNQPMPWLKMAGGAMICWLRETHPELSEEWSV